MRTAATILLALVFPASAAAITPEQAREVGVARAKTIGTVKSVDPVEQTTLEEAEATLAKEPQPILQRSQMAPAQDELEAKPVFRVTTRGRFYDTTAKVPPGYGPPTGTVLEQVYDPDTGQRLAVHLGGGKAPTAVIARRKHRAHKASWAYGRCSQYTHCYAVAEWYMPNTGEKVRGSESDIETTAMVVGDWANGGFVDHEKWTVFPANKSPVTGLAYWVEVGQEAGNRHDCCGLRWFTAWNNGAGYGANESPWAEPAWTFVRYRTDSQLNGTWCFTVEVGIAGCYGGFPAYAKDVQVGIEAVTDQKPYTSMSSQSNVVWTNNTTHPWASASWTVTGELCMSAFSRESPPHYYPGNVNAGSC